MFAGSARERALGLSLYLFGTDQRPPLLRGEGGNSELADATAPIHYSGNSTP